MSLIPDAPPGKVCPLHKKDMAEVCKTCPWWTQLRGKHPVTNADIDEWGCAISFLPILLIENAKETRQGAAAIESFRNEMVQANQRGAALQSLGFGINGAKMINS